MIKLMLCDLLIFLKVFINLIHNYKNLYKNVTIMKKNILINSNYNNLLNNINISVLKNEAFVDQTAIDFILKSTLIYIFNNKTSKKIIEFICIKNIVDSIQSFIKGAYVTEREIFELFGIFFNNAFDLRRLLTDYSLIGYPLKKIYPLTGFLEISYSIFKILIHKKLNLLQDIRNFETKLLWHNK